MSLGSDAVLAAERWAAGVPPSGDSAIEQIAQVYGRQAVVVSIDPRRVYVASESDAPSSQHTVVRAPAPGPQGEAWCWYQATTQGGRVGRDIDAVTVARACEALGAGEIMLNCIDADGQGAGYELPLIMAVQAAVSIPVIASSGAGSAAHFTAVFAATNVEAALAAGMFHRREVAIADVKLALLEAGLPVRNSLPPSAVDGV